ncbi:MAG: hypothetical protein ACTSV7_14820 [Candidatus Baldrarchaeia archaeon]
MEKTVRVRGYVRRTSSDAKKELKKLLPKGSIVYTVLRHTSPSGMTRWVDMLYVKNNEIGKVPPSLVEQLEGWPFSYDIRKEGWKVTGVGMDVGFQLVYTLSYLLYNDDYALGHRWI